MKRQILLADNADQNEIKSAQDANKKNFHAKNYSLLVVR
jgi:hypothetical protein